MEGHATMPEADGHLEIRYEAHNDVVSESSGERIVILTPDGTALNTINRVGAIVWQRLPARRAEIVSDLRCHFPDVGVAVLERDTDQFLDEMMQQGLIVAVHAAG